MSYQLINITDSTQNIVCPYCQQAVLDWEQEQYIQPCDHTLFIAMDLGFEYIADRFEETLSQSVDEIHEDANMNIFSSISKSTYEDVLILKSELGVEGMFRYIGLSCK